MIATIALGIGTAAFLPNVTKASAKSGLTVGFGWYDAPENIKHKFGELKDGTTLYMYEGQYISILEPACDIVVTKGDPDTIESSIGTHNNYFSVQKTGEVSVDHFFVLRMKTKRFLLGS